MYREEDKRKKKRRKVHGRGQKTHGREIKGRNVRRGKGKRNPIGSEEERRR